MQFPPDQLPRRSFLTRSLVGGAALTAGSMAWPATSALPASRLAAMAWGQEPPAEDDPAAFAQGVELALAELYRAVLEGDRLSSSTAQIVRDFGNHHRAHADALGEALGTAEAPVEGESNQAVLDLFGPRFDEADGEQAVLQVAREVEEAMAATYHLVLGGLEDAGTASTAAAILAVESQHATVLGRLLEVPLEEAVPDFQGQDDALDPDQFAAS